MALKLTEQSGPFNIPPDALELVPGFPVLIQAKALPLGRRLELFDEKGRIVAALKKNITGNTEQEKSYTLELPDGQKMLVPVPCFSSSAGLYVDVRENEDIEFTVPANSAKFFYRVADEADNDVSSVRPKISELRELKEEWQEFGLEDDECLVMYGEKRDVLARVYKAAHKAEYILRDPAGRAHAHIFEGDAYEAGNKKGNRLDYDVRDGKFRIKGEPKVTLVVERVSSMQKIHAGRDGFLRGVINGGREVVIASYREVGRVKDSYVHRNEDCGGSSVDTAVVVDGMGGNVYGPLLSDYATEAVLTGSGDFTKVVQGAHERTNTFVRLCQEKMVSGQNDEDEWFQSGSPQKDAQVKKKYPVPDAVMSAVRFEGDILKTMVLGDAVVCVIRDDRIVYKSREHSVVAQQVAMGRMTKREAMTSGLRSIVSTTLVGSFAPDYDEFQLQKGDKVLLMTDGGIMPDGVILHCVSGHTSEKGVENLLDAKREENEFGGGYYDPDDGGTPVAVCSMDNTTYLLVDHD